MVVHYSPLGLLLLIAMRCHAEANQERTKKIEAAAWVVVKEDAMAPPADI
jgi:hypothetical protein